MPGPDLPEIPGPLKSIQHYLKIATEHDQRDPVVSYWARLYALQSGLKISTKTAAENNVLLKLMDWLEVTKKSLIDNEAITNEVVAQAHLENWALKLFLYADKNDREGNFNKSVIQSFYTAGLLYDVLTTFGELTEEAAQNRKYAKWKAAYIHNCLKNGETPVPGPMKEEGDDDDNSNVNVGPGPDEDLSLYIGADNEPSEIDNGEEEKQAGSSNEAEDKSADSEQVEDAPAEPDVDSVPAEGDEQEENQVDETPTEQEGESAEPEKAEEGSSEPGIDPASVDEDIEGHMQPTPPPNTDAFGFPMVPGSGNPSLPIPATPNPYNPAPTPTSPSVPADFTTTPKSTGGATLNPEQMIKASKYIKWAGSAINYDDVTTAIDNLQKALHLLTTGEDS